MSDTATAKDTSSSDLRLLVTGSADRVTIKDRKGAEHLLCPLDMSDLIEYESNTQNALLGGDLSKIKFRDIAFLLYLSLRKEGCSDEEIAARRFKYKTEREVYMLFDLACFAKSAELFVDLLRISGLDMRPQQASQKNETAEGSEIKA